MRNSLYKIVVLFFAISAVSCIEELVDENVGGVLTPTITGSILYFETTEALINSSGSNPVLIQSANFDGFNAEVFAGRVLSGSLTYELTNTTSKQLDILLELLDDGGAVLDSELFSLNPNTSTPISRETFYGPPSANDINIIKNLSEIRLTVVNNGDFTGVSNAAESKFIFKSKGEFKLQLIQ